ncbi:MAG TPA: cupredoxin domain-containing protein [Actinomycetota bacterium]
MRRVGSAAAALLVVALTAAPAGAKTVVSAVDDAFEPESITVRAGEPIVWTMDGDNPHTVTADDGSFDSGTLDPGDTFDTTFADPGTYDYYCAFHGAAGGIGMSGTITVSGSSGGPGGGDTSGGGAGLAQTGPAATVVLAGLWSLVVGACARARARRLSARHR